MKIPKVVIVGAGFGGITAAHALADVPVEVTIIDENNFHTFSPLLYQVATAGLSSDEVASNLRGIMQSYPNVEAQMGTVTGVDLERREVLCDRGRCISYDYLILAAGAVTNDFGVPGVEECAIGLKSVADAVSVRSAVLKCFEIANSDPSMLDDGILTIVVAGGGPTGVELCGALAELFTKVLAKDFKNLDVRRARVVLVEMTDHVLGSFTSESQEIAKTELELRGVDLRLGTAIKSVDADAVTLSDGTRIKTQTVIWAAGVKVNPLAAALGLGQETSGRLSVGEDLSVPDHPEVFVIGDLSGARDPDDKAYPQLAPVAMQQARHVARTLSRRLSGKQSKRFRYTNKGTMATIGRRAAVAELPFGIRLSGTLGWLSWLALHLVFLISFRDRVIVLVNWAWNYVKWERGNRIIVELPKRDEEVLSRD